MKILQRYLLKEVLKAVVFVLIAFLALFAFFDLIGELPSVGKGGYRLQHVFLYIALGFPGYIYELIPFAVLIGTIYVMAMFAQNSEFTIMRVSSLSTLDAVWMLAKIGLIFLAFTYVVGEAVTPLSSRVAADFRNGLIGRNVSDRFKTGLWSRDTLYSKADNKTVVGTRFMNVGTMKQNGAAEDIKLYEFNNQLELVKIVTAKTGTYEGDNVWQLYDVTNQDLQPAMPKKDKVLFPKSAPKLVQTKIDQMEMISEVTPDILSVITVDANKMSAYELAVYSSHLVENKQDATSYQIAFWKKIVYPFSIFVMMGLALPFAYLHFRSGGISLKIFTGIMIGVAFILLNNLFSHVGLLNTWPPFLTAVTPSAIFLICAVFALRWVERH